MRQKTQIVLLIIGSVVALTSLAWMPVLGFQYLFWRMHLILDSVSDEELISRTNDLPEVKAFLEKYENASPYVSTDYHIGVEYSISECQLTGMNCRVAQPYVATLEIVFSLDSGYPEHSRFWCQGTNHGKAPIGDPAVIQKIANCA